MILRTAHSPAYALPGMCRSKALSTAPTGAPLAIWAFLQDALKLERFVCDYREINLKKHP